MSWGEYLFGFRGRVNRNRYWNFIFVGFLFLAFMVSVAIPYVLIEHPSTSTADRPLSPLGIATLAAEGVIVVAYFLLELPSPLSDCTIAIEAAGGFCPSSSCPISRSW